MLLSKRNELKRAGRNKLERIRERFDGAQGEGDSERVVTIAPKRHGPGPRVQQGMKRRMKKTKRTPRNIALLLQRSSSTANVFELPAWACRRSEDPVDTDITLLGLRRLP